MAVGVTYFYSGSSRHYCQHFLVGSSDRIRKRKTIFPPPSLSHSHTETRFLDERTSHDTTHAKTTLGRRRRGFPGRYCCYQKFEGKNTPTPAGRLKHSVVLGSSPRNTQSQRQNGTHTNALHTIGTIAVERTEQCTQNEENQLLSCQEARKKKHALYSTPHDPE